MRDAPVVCSEQRLRNTPMKHNIITTISAVAAGAAAMYYLDPEQGKRRRALVRDTVISASLHTADATRAQGRRTANRLKGWISGLMARFSSSGGFVTRRRLQDRVRSHLGHLVSHPKAVIVEGIGDGRVRLTGHILENELVALLTGVESVSGVVHVEDELMVHESAGSVPELQGASPRQGQRLGGRDRVWRALAMLAPVAILAATVRPASRRLGLIERLSSERRALPFSSRRHALPMMSGSGKLRRYFKVLRAS